MAPMEILAAIVCVVMTLMSIYPGFLDAAFCQAILLYLFGISVAASLGPLYCFMCAVRGVLPAWPKGLTNKPHPPRVDREIGIGEVGGKPLRRASRRIPRIAIAVSLVLWLSGLPRWLAFAASRPAFERCLAARTPIGGEGGAPARFVGLYRIDERRADRRGGVCFRCDSFRDGFRPHSVSYGFAHRPNAIGSPFGNCDYSLSHLVGEWYLFTALDDW